ncbi:glycosyltransferase family 4 protein [Spirulina sp. 06S082]|uniref:glycosyltransferase family 4 protein n=1 Tax=Spirulina sp. 06S082 TaxID=3110248 RepID=UPI002B220179|nr:glycosyltransferase family 4 protein [Spirulina sp. 06S082]MEA5470459.1 glycosyltransferase family 4 protein [Spirulina sp. 06S082]
MTNPKITLIHPTGNPFARNAAIALWEIDMLQEIITSVAYNPDGNLARILQKFFPAGDRELRRRIWIPPQNRFLKTYPREEILRIALLRTGLNRSLGLNSQSLADWVYGSIDRRVARKHLKGLTGVYAYEDGAASTFSVAKQQGIKCFYDLPIVFYRQSQQIQQEEAELFPDLAASLQSIQEPARKLERKEQEVSLADHIIVPSTIVARSLLNAGISKDKITVIPFGSPHDYFQPQPKQDKQFRALFVGRVGARKGVHYLLQAWQKLNLHDAELLLVGMNEFGDRYLGQYQEYFRYIPSVPHATLNQYYSSASVFVFPSLVEGLALVLLEAMACGIPIITTENAGGSDIITDGVEGFIIPIRDVEAIQEKLAWCYAHPQELAEMGKAARQKAEELTWKLYRDRLSSLVLKVIS